MYQKEALSNAFNFSEFHGAISSSGSLTPLQRSSVGVHSLCTQPTVVHNSMNIGKKSFLKYNYQSHLYRFLVFQFETIDRYIYTLIKCATLCDLDLHDPGDVLGQVSSHLHWTIGLEDVNADIQRNSGSETGRRHNDVRTEKMYRTMYSLFHKIELMFRVFLLFYHGFEIKSDKLYNYDIA